MLVSLNEQDVNMKQQHWKKTLGFANAHAVFNLKMLVLKE